MIDLSAIDYSHLDRPEVLMFLFHPRPEWGGEAGSGEDLLIPVEQEVSIGARLHFHDASSPTILFFHGNGEIVADYDDLGPLYVQNGINFLPVDYRGYGRSGGRPSVTAMMRDCHVIFDFVQGFLKKRECTGPLILMGRSLGSASTLELAAHYEALISGLIIESGFAFAGPLLRLLGLDTQAMGFEEEQGFRNIDKIARVHRPTLVIHAQYDHIIPFSDGKALFEASPAKEKRFLEIKGANHNDIFIKGLEDYLRAVKHLVKTVA